MSGAETGVRAPDPAILARPQVRADLIYPPIIVDEFRATLERSGMPLTVAGVRPMKDVPSSAVAVEPIGEFSRDLIDWLVGIAPNRTKLLPGNKRN